jgi:hypothetical protein
MNSTMGKFDITVISFVCCTLFCLENNWELPVSIIHELEHPVSIIYELSWYTTKYGSIKLHGVKSYFLKKKSVHYTKLIR